MLYNHKKILIWGIGLTGISCVNFFIKKGIIPRIIDTRINIKKSLLFHKMPKFIKIKLGLKISTWIFESDLIVISPGISIYHPLLVQAAKFGIEIIGDIELFCRETNKPIIAITGSNGKTTVTTMLKNIAKQQKTYTITVGGNIGIPALDILNDKTDIYILELSSFQLETTYSLKAHVAVVLNITPDHIDRYPLGFKQYKKTKLKIYQNAKTCIFNIKDNFTKLINLDKYQKKVTFGKNFGDYYISSYKLQLWISYKNEKLVNIKNILLKGTHNLENILATIAISDIIGFSRKNILKVILSYTGLKHRFQVILNKNNIKWINDSKSTNIDSTIKAINSIQLKGTLWLILGGYAKNANFSILDKHLNYKKTKIYCYGTDGKNIANLFPKISINVNTLAEIIFLITKKIKPNDVVLLSPGCSSTDQFVNFEERGNLFSKLVKQLC